MIISFNQHLDKLNTLEAIKQENAALILRVSALEKELADYKEKYAQSLEAYRELLHAFKQSMRREFGAKSERFIDKCPEQQDMFYSAASSEAVIENNARDEKSEFSNVTAFPKKPRKKAKRCFSKAL